MRISEIRGWQWLITWDNPIPADSSAMLRALGNLGRVTKVQTNRYASSSAASSTWTTCSPSRMRAGPRPEPIVGGSCSRYSARAGGTLRSAARSKCPIGPHALTLLRPVAERRPLPAQMQAVLNLIRFPGTQRGDDVIVALQGIGERERIRGCLCGAGRRVRPRNEGSIPEQRDTPDRHAPYRQVLDRLEKRLLRRFDEHAERRRQVSRRSRTEIGFRARRKQPWRHRRGTLAPIAVLQQLGPACLVSVAVPDPVVAAPPVHNGLVSARDEVSQHMRAWVLEELKAVRQPLGRFLGQVGLLNQAVPLDLASVVGVHFGHKLLPNEGIAAVGANQ